MPKEIAEFTTSELVEELRQREYLHVFRRREVISSEMVQMYRAEPAFQERLYKKAATALAMDLYSNKFGMRRKSFMDDRYCTRVFEYEIEVLSDKPWSKLS